MKALTLTQPWATLITIGAKRMETRSWSSSYRGPLAIHAAAGLGLVGGKQGLMELCRTEPFMSALPQVGVYGVAWLPRGAIVAVCELICCKTITAGSKHYGWSAVAGRDWPVTDQERAFGDYSAGRYAWLLADIRALSEPIPCKGALSLWELPESVAAAVESEASR